MHLRPTPWLALASILLVVLLSGLAVQPPRAKPASAPATQFSAERAMAHIREMAQKPHPVGSEEAARVRDYLLEELRQLGLEPQVQATTAFRSRGSVALAARVENVMARLPGTANTKAVLLMAHYDSVPTGPGAADDASSVAAILEGVRALQATGPLKNDLIILFTDAEEVGLLGAQAFVDEHPWASDIGVAFNFEARGTDGPAIMFRTTPENGWLIREFARAAPSARTTSLAGEVFKRMPNDTDHTVFELAGIPSFDHAYIGTFPSYHSELDNVSRVSLRSVQHHGTYIVGVAGHFGNLDLTETRAPDRIYFDLFGKALHYPLSLALPLALLGAAFTLGVIIWGLIRRRLSLLGTGLSLLAALLVLALSGAIAFGWTQAVIALFPAEMISGIGGPYDGGLYMWMALLMVIAAMAGLYGLLRRWLATLDLWAGGLLLWTALAVATALAIPGGSYMFLWPLLPATGALLAALRRDGEASMAGQAASLALPVLPLLLFLPLGSSFFGVIPLQLFAVLAVVYAALPMLLLTEHLEAITAPRRWLLPAAAVAGALALTVTAYARIGSHPVSESVVLYQNLTTGKAYLALRGLPTDWGREVLGSGARMTPWSELHPAGSPSRQMLAAPIQAPTANGPEIRVLNERVDGGERVLHLLVQPAGEAYATILNIGWDAGVTSLELDQYQLKASPVSTFVFYNPPPGGFSLTVRMPAANRFSGVLHDAYNVPPGSSQLPLPPRPAGSIPSPDAADGITLLRTFDL